MSFKVFINKFSYRLVYYVAKRVTKKKYSFTTDRVPKVGEPYIMISNHTTEEDMLFAGLASKRHMYYVCGEHLLRNKTYGKLLRVLINPIPLPKGGASLEAVKEMIKRIKQGYNVCLFPEGKRSFHGETIPASLALGKLVKKTGGALVTYKVIGGYFTYPRWARQHQRTGHVEGKVMGVYSSEELKKMTAQEVTDIINRDTYENAYETQREKNWDYIGTDKAKGMEHVLFMCPKCGGMDTIQTEGDSFHCTKCGMKGVYNDKGFLEGECLPYDNVLEWMRWEEPQFDKYVEEKGDELLFTDENVTLYTMLEDYTNKDILKDKLEMYRDRLVIGEYTFPLNEISFLSILFGNILLFTYKDTYYGLTGETFHAWKGGRLWHLVKGDADDRTKEL